MAKSNFQKVQEFNRAFDMVSKEPKNYTGYTIDSKGNANYNTLVNIRPELFKNSPQIINLRLDLIKEEIGELNTAMSNNDFIETRDAIADILYVVYGMADVLGIAIDTSFVIMYNEIFNNLTSEQKKLIHDNQKNFINKIDNTRPLGLSNFDLIKLLFVMRPYPSELFDKSSYEFTAHDYLLNLIYITYKDLETKTLLINNSINNIHQENIETNFINLSKIICDLLKFTYSLAVILNINSDSDFAIVHNSNMSKLCDNEDDAKATVIDYDEKFKTGKSPYDSPYYYYLEDIGKYIVKNKSTGKALKNIKYKKVIFSG